MSIKRQFFWSMVPLLAVTALNIVSVPLFLRFLGEEKYALWFYVITFSGAFGFADLGLGVAVGRYIGVALGAQDTAAVRQYWGTGNLIVIPLLLLMAIIFAVIGVLFGPKWFPVAPTEVSLLQWAFVWGGVALFLAYYTQFWLVLAQAHFDFKFIGLWRSILNVVQVLLAVFLAYLTRNPLMLILGGIAVSAVQLLFFVHHGAKHYQLGLNLRDASMRRAREMSGYTCKAFSSLLTGSFLGSLDRLLLGKLAPPASFTHYTVCNNLAARLQAFSGAIMGPVFQQTNRAVGKGSRETAAQIYNETFNFTFGWFALVALWAVFWHPVFLRIWLGERLAPEVAPAFVPLLIAFCLSAVASISTAQLASFNRVGLELGFNLVNSLFRAGCVVVGWYWAGLAGAAWGVLASRIVVVAQDLYVIRMIGGGGWRALSTWKHLLGQFLIGLVFFALSRPLPHPSVWEICPAALHGTLVAAWLLRNPLRRWISGTSVALFGGALT